MKTALFMILVTESLINELHTKWVPENATTNKPLKIINEDEKGIILYDTDSIQVPLGEIDQEDQSKKQNLNNTYPEKAMLRYGFQQTQQCKDYEKAFMCIRKCLDMGYDLANADKKCICTCRRNRMLHMHKQLLKLHSSTPWKGGAPTTSLPPWVQKQSSKIPQPVKNAENHDYELFADVSFSQKAVVNNNPDTNANSNQPNDASGASGEGGDDGDEKGDGTEDTPKEGDEDGTAAPENGEEGEAAAEDGEAPADDEAATEPAEAAEAAEGEPEAEAKPEAEPEAEPER